MIPVYLLMVCPSPIFEWQTSKYVDTSHTMTDRIIDSYFAGPQDGETLDYVVLCPFDDQFGMTVPPEYIKESMDYIVKNAE